MTEPLFFDSLTHTSRSGKWLAEDRFDSSLARLLDEIEQVRPYRACLVNIAGYSDNAELQDIAEKHRDLFVPFAGFDPSQFEDSGDVPGKLRELSERGFAGIKLHPRLNAYDPLDERCLATVAQAGAYGLVVMIDTLFRQRSRFVGHPADIIDKIAFACPGTQIILLHGAASAMLDIYETVRMRSNLLLDLSFTLMRYAGSSLDADMKFILSTLDQRATVGSDFPEYSLPKARSRIATMTEGLPTAKTENILHGNLERFLAAWLAKFT